MLEGQASHTALRVAHRRAVHQIVDAPPVLTDPVAVPLLGESFRLDREHELHPMARALRCFMAVRSRFTEDKLAEAVQAGVRQYVLLGAGLDTFAYRNPFAGVRVFEVDFPATQMWKRELLAKAGIAVPEEVRFVPLDFEHRTLAEGLLEAGFDAEAPAFFGWLGVTMYLSREAFRATVETIGRLPEGSGASFDYMLPLDALGEGARRAAEAIAARVAASGEPFRLFFRQEEMEAELHAAGFHRVEHMDGSALNERYFGGRADGLRLPENGPGRLVAAWR